MRDKNGRANYRRILFFLIALTAVLPLVSLNIGFYGLEYREVFDFLFKGRSAVSENAAVILNNIRVPRILAAFVVGGGLALAGAGYQGAFRNPLVSENIIGVSHGAGLGAALALMLRLGNFSVQLFAFAAGIIAVAAAYFIGSRAKFNRDVSLILAGSMLSSVCSASITAIKYLADPNDTLPAITYWLMGSFAKVNFNSMLFSAVPIALGCAVIFLMRWRLNILTLGDDAAMSMGVNPALTRAVVIMASTVVCSAAICVSGQIGWIGLMVPHMARGLAGSDHRKMLPVSALMGGCFLLLMDNVARSVSAMELPIGVLTSFCGAPFFVYLLLRRKG